MKKRVFITTFIAICVFGLAFVQYRYLQIGLNLARVQFNKNLNASISSIRADLANENQLTYLMASAMAKDTTFFTISPDSIVEASNYFLNDFLRAKLIEKGVEADFDYQIMSKDSMYYLHSIDAKENSPNKVIYPIVLEGYLSNVLEKRLVLELQFSDLNRYFLGQLNGLILPSLIFLIGLVVLIIWILRTYYWQKKVITTTDEFINNLTHELKSPVYAIQLSSKMLAEEVNQDLQDYVHIINQESKRLQLHVEKVLELAKMDKKKEVMVLKPVRLQVFLNQWIHKQNKLAALELYELTWTIEVADTEVLVDEFHLENALNNILDNARKYAESPKILFEAKSQTNEVTLMVKDNGMGISKEDLPKVFDKYFRAKSDNLHTVKGFGLGLSYVKRVVTKHKGKIKIESQLGLGTKVTLSLPIYK